MECIATGQLQGDFKLPPSELKELGDLPLVPGMPAEVFIRTQDRTPLDYLIKPLQEQVARTFRER